LLPPCRAALLTPICTKSFVGWGFAYSAPPDPLAVFRGLLLKGEEGSGMGGKTEGEEEIGGGEKRGEKRRERGGRGKKGREEFVLCPRKKNVDAYGNTPTHPF